MAKQLLTLNLIQYAMGLVFDDHPKLLALLIGFLSGYAFSMIYVTLNDDDLVDSRLIEAGETRNSDSTELEKAQSANNQKHPNIILEKPFRVLCMVITFPENHATRAENIKATWGKRCTFLLFLSTIQDDTLPSVALAVPENSNYLWGKVREAFRYAWVHYHDKVDWFFKVEDDTYPIIENLRLLLSNYSSSDSIWFGYKRSEHKGDLKSDVVSHHEGAGYVLSKEAARRFAEHGYFNHSLCRRDMEGTPRFEMGLCMKRLNVTAIDSTDSEGKERFFPHVPENHLTENNKNAPALKELGCCSDTAITYHYFEPDQLLLMEYLIYHLEPYNFEN